MRLNRTNRILAAVLAIQLVATLAAVFLLPALASHPAASGPLLQNFDATTVTALAIKDNSKNEVDLAKDSSGNWVLPKADNYPANGAAITTLLNNIKALQANRLIAQEASSADRLQVSATNFQRLVEITGAGGKVNRLYIGSSGGANATHMRVNDDTNVYLTNGLAATDAGTSASSWIASPFFSFNQDGATRLTVQNAQGTFDFQNSGATASGGGAWTMAGLTASDHFDPQSVTRYLPQLSSLSIVAPIGKTAQDKFGMTKPLATITIVVSERPTPPPQPSSTPTPKVLNVPVGPSTNPTAVPAGPTPTPILQTYTLQIGAKLDNGDYVMKASTSPYFVDVSASTAETFINLKRADLMLPPTPTPTAGPTSTATPQATGAATTAATSASTSAAPQAPTLTVTPTSGG
ncbi:MAG TPA: DUF4340 domain-containing protein [Aggregatilineales bacterium]|nr:DUF4340 domain-containing protein [Aggregatilineales bacterium]